MNSPATPGPARKSQHKRILVFASDFSTSEGDRWLIDDLVDEFLEDGAEVDVLVFDNKRPRPRGVATSPDRRLRTISVGPMSVPQGTAAKIYARFTAVLLMHTTAYRVLRGQTYDFAVFTSVGAVSAGLPSLLRAKGVVRRLIFILWDFFPVHQIEIGRLPLNQFTRLLRHLEYFSFAKADIVALMSPANERFFAAYFPKFRGKTIILPPWAQADPPGSFQARKAEIFTAVFGGQLVEGRGVDTIVRAASVLERRGVELKVVIAGDGSLRNGLEALAKSLAVTNVEFAGMIPRPKYRELLTAAHVGIAATVEGVSVPAFPSKIVEYCRASLPVVACLDRASDAGDLLLEFGAGVVVEANDAEGLADVLEALTAEYSTGRLAEKSRSARRLFDTRLSSTSAAHAIAAAAGPASTEA